MNENEEYKKGYRDGFKDGLDYEKNPKTYPKTTPYTPNPYITPWKDLIDIKSKCMVCGIDLNGLTHYCCMNSRCPSRVHSTFTVKYTTNTTSYT